MLDALVALLPNAFRIAPQQVNLREKFYYSLGDGIAPDVWFK